MFGKMKTNIKYVACILALLVNRVGGGNSVSHTGVKGDQTVGGIHLFEIHSPSGGMGLGLKLLILLAVALAVAYWCLRQKTKKVARTAAITSAAGATQYALQMAPLQMAAAGMAAGAPAAPGGRVGPMDLP